MAHKSPTRNGEDSGEDSTVWDVRPARGDLGVRGRPRSLLCSSSDPPAPVARELMSEEEERL